MLDSFRMFSASCAAASSQMCLVCMILASTATRRLRAGPPHGQRVAPATRALRRARTSYSPTQRSDEPHTPQKSSAAGHAALSFEGDVATRSGCGRARPHAKGRFVAGGTTGPADNNTPIDRQPSDDYHVAVAELAVPSLETLEHFDFTVAFRNQGKQVLRVSLHLNEVKIPETSRYRPKRQGR